MTEQRGEYGEIDLSEDDKRLRDIVKRYLRAEGIEKKYVDAAYEYAIKQIRSNIKTDDPDYENFIRPAYKELSSTKNEFKLNFNPETSNIRRADFIFYGSMYGHEKSAVLEDFKKIRANLKEHGIGALVYGGGTDNPTLSIEIKDENTLRIMEAVTEKLVIENTARKTEDFLKQLTKKTYKDFDKNLQYLILDAAGDNQTPEFAAKIISTVGNTFEYHTRDNSDRLWDLALKGLSSLNDMAKSEGFDSWADQVAAARGKKSPDNDNQNNL